MTITYPRALPSLSRWVRFRFELERVDYLSPETGGSLGAVSAGSPVWTLDAEAMPKTEAETEMWRAWVRSLRGPQKTFIAGPNRAYPLDYPQGFSGGFSGASSGWSVSAERDVLTMTGVPAALHIRPGDCVGFTWSTNKATLVSSLEEATASGGGSITFAVEPPLPPVVIGGAVASFASPHCVMRLAPTKPIGPQDASRLASMSIMAMQDLRE